MKRRLVLAAGGGATLGAAAPIFGQTQQKPRRIGVVQAGVSQNFKPDPILRDAMRELGYDEGRNLVFERRFTEGQNDWKGPLPGLYAELVKQRVDVILTDGDRQTSAAKASTSTIPIVMLYSDTPVEIGFVASLNRPGSNITGMTAAGPESARKGLQMLSETVPMARHLGVLRDPDYAAGLQFRKAYEQAAQAMGCKLSVWHSHSLDALEASLAAMVKEGVEAVFVTREGAVHPNRSRIIAFTALHRLPAMWPDAHYVAEGGLIARNADEVERTRRVAAIIDRILKGERPANIPVEQPTRFAVTVNLKTARSIGLTIPRSVLLQATEVIE